MTSLTVAKATREATTPPADDVVNVPPLQDGDRLTRAECRVDEALAEALRPDRARERILEDLLHAGREGHRPVETSRADVDEANDAAARLAVGDTHETERLRGNRFLDSQQPEQDVLGAYLPVLQRARFAFGRGQRLTAVDAEPLDQRFFRAAAAARAERNAWVAITGP